MPLKKHKWTLKASLAVFLLLSAAFTAVGVSVGTRTHAADRFSPKATALVSAKLDQTADDQAAVDQEQAFVNALASSKKYYFDQSTDPVSVFEASSALLEPYGIAFAAKDGFSYKLKVPSIAASGDLPVTIAVSKDSTLSTNSAPISVSAVKTNWTKIAAKIATLSIATQDETTFKAVDKKDQPLELLSADLGVDTEWGDLIDSELKLLWSKPANSPVITFALRSSVGTDGTAKDLQSGTVTVTSFAKTGRELLDAEITLINGLRSSHPYYFDERSDTTVDRQPVNSAQLAEYGIDLVTKNGLGYAISRDTTAPGNFSLNIIVTAGNYESESNDINVYGVHTNWAEALAKINALNYSALDLEPFKDLDKSDQIVNGPLTDLGIRADLGANLDSGVTLAWSKEANSAIVRFDLYGGRKVGSEGYKIRTATAEIVAFFNPDHDAVEDEQAVVNALTPSAEYYFDDRLEAVTGERATSVGLSRYNIAFVPKDGFAYSLTHPALSASGTLPITITVRKNTAEGASVPITVTAVRTNWTRLLSIISNIDASALTDAQFQAVAGTYRPLSELSSVLGVSVDLVSSVSTGTSLWWSKAADSTALTFDLYEGDKAGDGQTKLQTATTTLARFSVSQDAQEVGLLARQLSQITTTSKTGTAFKALAVAEGAPLNKSLADTLGFDLPAFDPGVSATAKKTQGSAVVTYTVSKGTESQTADATFDSFAKEEAASAGDSPPNIGVIVGGTIGAAAGLGLAGGLTYYLVRRSRSKSKA